MDSQTTELLGRNRLMSELLTSLRHAAADISCGASSSQSSEPGALGADVSLLPNFGRRRMNVTERELMEVHRCFHAARWRTAGRITQFGFNKASCYQFDSSLGRRGGRRRLI